ncbi:hypothetical protein FJY84_08785 [Candidatus Bathyarchaeota archaeon]|nr:hypothetical protein [Candidatus Bathyarchaeota archaeon]
MISAAEIYAASCSYEDVSSAIDLAQIADTVRVPAGTCTWNNQLVIRKGINLIGTGIGNTIIISNYEGTGWATHTSRYLIVYWPQHPANNELFRLSGFTFDCDRKSGGIFLVNGNANYPINKIRIDHTRIINASGHNLCQHGPVYGVADNNDWQGGTIVGIFSLDAQIWNSHTFNFGTADNFYFEDNNFTGGSVVNSGWGGRYAFRYNDITLTAHSFPTFDAHGNMGPGMGYSMMGVEIYENVIHGGSYMCRTVDLRGGRSLVYNNKLINTVSAGAVIREEYDDAGNPPTHALDGQPQHIWDTYYFGNTRNNIRMPFDSVGTFDYGSRDCGEWENQGCHEGRVPTHNIHFWQQEATFDGSSGVGAGLISQRPATCTTEGVAWWATDEEKLYRCKNGAWKLYYVPYPYPHPLRLGDSEEIDLGEIIPEPDPPQPTLDVVTIQDMLGAYQQYKRNEVTLAYFLDKLRKWIVFW